MKNEYLVVYTEEDETHIAIVEAQAIEIRQLMQRMYEHRPVVTHVIQLPIYHKQVPFVPLEKLMELGR